MYLSSISCTTLPLHQVQKGMSTRTSFTLEEDPTGKLRDIAARWQLDKALHVSRLDPDRGLIRCSYKHVQPGDFVDVTVLADIASIRTMEGYTTVCHYKLNGIVKLQDARVNAVQTYATISICIHHADFDCSMRLKWTATRISYLRHLSFTTQSLIWKTLLKKTTGMILDYLMTLLYSLRRLRTIA